jgi:hypothetical protein
MARFVVEGAREWADDLDAWANGILDDKVKRVLGRGANSIKKEWRQRWTGMPHVRALPSAITYDVTDEPVGPAAEIGPKRELRRQAPLAVFLEFGSVHNAPIPGGQPALDAEEPKFVKALEDVVVWALEARRR